VLYRAVRRLAGPVAGIVAAAVLAVSPVTVALNRGNVSDSLLILLTVLAADATSAALLTGRLRTLLLAGMWVGLAFQAKMVQAWLVLPALALAYLVAAPPRLRVRLGHVALAGAVTVMVSLSWMTAVSLVPAHERPYVDGSTNDSVYAQVFDYNGLARLGGRHGDGAGTPAPFLRRIARAGTALNSYSARIGRSWHRLLSGLFGRDDGWLLPAALLAAAGVLLERRGTGRRDPVRAGVVLWSTWLAVLGVAFSDGVYLNSYYVAALSPATAALCGIGAATCWRRRASPAARALLAGAVLACTGYGIYLLLDATAVPAWLVTSALAVGLAGAVAALTSPRLGGAAPTARPVATAVVASALLLPAVASVEAVARHVDPFTAPFEPGATAVGRISVAQLESSIRAIVGHLSGTYRTPIAFATDSSSTAATYVYYTGREVLPIGGYGGGVPSPTLARLRQYIASGQLRAFLVPIEPPGSDPRVVWVRAHCKQAQRLPRDLVQLAFYACSPQAARQAD
jgi:4-amino-4-deoxy-L-arabinose transferase-like glycosyltransferase